MNPFASIYEQETRYVRLYTFHSRDIRFTTAGMRECATQANASHWISPNRGEVHAVFHRRRYVYTVQIFYWASSTIEQLKDATRQEIQAVNIDTLGNVFQNLE